jgi:hypothetical protein
VLIYSSLSLKCSLPTSALPSNLLSRASVSDPLSHGIVRLWAKLCRMGNHGLTLQAIAIWVSASLHALYKIILNL